MPANEIHAMLNKAVGCHSICSSSYPRLSAFICGSIIVFPGGVF
jgi:hypothetical protein